MPGIEGRRLRLLPRRTPRRFLAFAVACGAACVLLGDLPAQTPRLLRKPCLGTVVDGDDRPLEGAVVTFAWAPGPLPGEPDTVRATTDERGRFRADLVVGRGYFAWAVGPERADGTRLVSEIADRAASGALLALDARYVAAPRRVRVHRHLDWSTANGLPRLAWSAPPILAEALAVPPPDDEGWTLLPPSPFVEGTLVVGDFADVRRVAVGPDAQAVRFASPLESTLVVTDEAGVPLRDARVARFPSIEPTQPFGSATAWEVFRRWLDIGRTDAEGALVLRLPAPDPFGGDWLRIAAAGRVEKLVHQSALTNGQKWNVQLPPASAPRAKLRVRDEERAFGSFRLQAEVGSKRVTMTFSLPLAADTSETGVLALEHAIHGVECTGSVLHLIPHEGTQAVPRLVACLHEARPIVELTDVDLDTLRSVAVQVVDSDGAPCPGAELVLSPYGMVDLAGSTPFAADPTGRAVVVHGGKWLLHATAGSAVASVVLDGRATEVVLRLQPLPAVTVRVVDVEGRPVRGARAQVARGEYRLTPAIGRDEREPFRLTGWYVFRWLARARSDRDGVLAIPLAPHVDGKVVVVDGARRSEPFAVRKADARVVVK